jgi:thiol:disulfide interchange protein
MDESQHPPNREASLNARQAFVPVLVAATMLAAVFLLAPRRPRLTEWIPYSAASVAENKSEGKSSAVLYYARWTLSADPKGGLVSPAISQSLTGAGFVTMEADLTDYTAGSFDELKKQGFISIPVLVLYPTVGPRIAFDGGTPESEIISTVERLGR